MGSISNSPSACFVASDGKSLRVYQAVIDARTLLAEINTASRKSNVMESSFMSASSGHSTADGAAGLRDHAAARGLRDKFNIVSTQSTARPGAVIELEAIAEATQNWQSTLLLHAFQEQLILSQGCIPRSRNDPNASSAGLITSRMSAMVDLQQQAGDFHEPFYIVLAEKNENVSCVMMHMWRLDISSTPDHDGSGGSGETSGSATPTAGNAPAGGHHRSSGVNEVHVRTEKVCVQRLPLPKGVEIIHAVPAVGHLSSSSIYPACLAPYVMVTACSDNKIR